MDLADFDLVASRVVSGCPALGRRSVGRKAAPAILMTLWRLAEPALVGGPDTESRDLSKHVWHLGSTSVS